jgi:DNA-binding beta-propeller fold protein YncE
MNTTCLKIRHYVFPPLVSLIIILLSLVLSLGCSEGDGGSTRGSPPPSSSRKIFVVNTNGDKISVFDASDSEHAAPIRSIESKAGLSAPQGIFVDSKNNEIFVVNLDSIRVYDRTAETDSEPKRIIEGANTELFFASSIFVDTKNDEIFVVNFDSITVYERTATGNATPIRIIKGDSTELFSPKGIFVDTENNIIFVGSIGCKGQTPIGKILEYEREANGDMAPLRTISISELTDEGFPLLPTSIYEDIENDELYVADFSFSYGPSCPELILAPGPSLPIQQATESTVKVYRRTDEGEATPLRIIRGPNTGLSNPFGIIVDKAKNEIFVINSFPNTLTVYNRDDEGDVQPLRTLFISDTNNAGIIGERLMSFSISADPNSDEIFVANQNNTITVYRMEAEEDDEPLRVIGSNTGLLTPQWIYVDTVDNEIFVSNFSSRVITVHGLTDQGNIAPLRTLPQQQLFVPRGVFVDKENDEIYVASIFLSNQGLESIINVRGIDGTPLRDLFGSKTGLSIPTGIFVDAENNELFVANFGNNTITVYRSDLSDGNDEPVRTISTGLSFPQGIFVDTKNDELFVANSGSDTVTVYRRDASENNDEPIRSINTGLSSPQGIFVDTKNDEIFVTNLGNPFVGEKGKITVYRREAGEGEEPLRTIEGPETGLDGPLGIFVVESP